MSFRDCTNPLYRPLVAIPESDSKAIAFSLTPERLLLLYKLMYGRVPPLASPDIVADMPDNLELLGSDDPLLLFRLSFGKGETKKQQLFAITNITPVDFKPAVMSKALKKLESPNGYSPDGSRLTHDEVLNLFESVSFRRARPLDMRNGRYQLYGDVIIAPVIAFPCGQCLACRKTKASHMSTRLIHESSQYANCAFVTFTYDDLHVPVLKCLSSEVKTLYGHMPFSLRRAVHNLLSYSLPTSCNSAGGVSLRSLVSSPLAARVPSRALKSFMSDMQKCDMSYSDFIATLKDELFFLDSDSVSDVHLTSFSPRRSLACRLSALPDSVLRDLSNAIDRFPDIKSFLRDFVLFRVRNLQQSEIENRLISNVVNSRNSNLNANKYTLGGESLTVSWRDIHLFLHSLRHDKALAGVPYRYFVVNDYGDKTLRPHFHAIFFGVDFMQDAVIAPSNLQKPGSVLYQSPVLSKYWPYGHHTFAPVVNEQITGYVARYETSKAELGERINALMCAPLSSRMSLKPGIGETWFRKYGLSDAIANGFIVLNKDGLKVSVPSYYEMLCKRLYPVQFEDYRARKLKYYDGVDSMPDMYSDRTYTAYVQSHRVKKSHDNAVLR